MMPGSRGEEGRLVKFTDREWFGILLPCAVLGLTYILLLGELAPLPGACLKAAPLLLLIGWAASATETPRSLLVPALVFGLGGDLALAFDLFVPGLGSFLVGHLFYTALWLRECDLRRWPRLLLPLVFYLLSLALLLPHTGPMTLPVTLYISVICVMAATATCSRIPGFWGLLGVGSFLLSDLVIGWNRFVEPLAWERPFVMGTYYAAQILLCAAVIAHYRAAAPARA